MAWIRERRRKDGGVTYYVTWREPGATEESTLTIRDDKASAEMNVRLLEANNNSYAAAERAMSQSKIGGPTVREHMLRHIDMLTDAGPGTINRYKNVVRDHFSSTLGKIPVAAVEYADIVLWLKYMGNKPSPKNPGKTYSAKTIANHHGLLSASMETAIRIKVRTDNPCRGVSLPKDTATEEKMHFLTAEQSMAIVDELKEPYSSLVLLLRGTGLRFGEATALEAKDFKLSAKPPTVRVNRAWKDDGNNGFYVGDPKTKKSRRTVSLPPSLVTVIAPLIAAAKKDGGYVFREAGGDPVRQSRMFNYWKRALNRLGWSPVSGERPRIHDMRHTHASLMLGAGMPIYSLSRRLGHEAIATTIDRYSHLTPDAHFQGADIAESALAVESAGAVEGELIA